MSVGCVRRSCGRALISVNILAPIRIWMTRGSDGRKACDGELGLEAMRLKICQANLGLLVLLKRALVNFRACFMVG